MSELLSPEDVAGQCGLSRKAVYRAIERGELPASRLCSRLRIRCEDVERWIDANEVSDSDTTARRRTATGFAPAKDGLRSLLSQVEN